VSKAAFPLSFDDFVMLGMAVGNLPSGRLFSGLLTLKP
jgi:hypothetical protein